MADGLAITPGAGATVSTTEVTTLNGGAVPAQHVQRLGLAFRTAAGAAVDADRGIGAVSNGTQRVVHANDDPVVTGLNAIAAYVDGLEGLATSLNGYVDGLETLLGTANTLATSLNTYVDGLEALGAAATPAGANIIGKVGIDQTTDGVTNKANVDASLKSATATRTSVNSDTASAVIVASNANRRGATIFNSDANALLLDLSGGTASATRCQVRLTQYESYEVGSGYTGLITGIWEGNGGGIADVVEFT